MKSLSIAIRALLFFTVLTGIAYPMLVTGIAQMFFPFRANGSMVMKEGRPVGSELIGQAFDTTGIYFIARPSSVSYNPLPSGGSNYGQTSRELLDEFCLRKKQLMQSFCLRSELPIPSEMLFASASGLDPHISPEAALLQLDRVARTRNFTEEQTARLMIRIGQMTEPPQFLCLGQARINVLLLNLETDKIR
jgi:potassium-transporting ATPase KdpC subunit